MERHVLGFVFTLLFIVSNASLAHEAGGITVPDEVEVGGVPLQLNGAGVRRKFFFRIYVAALYLPRRTHRLEEVLDLKGPRRVLMHFLYSEVGKEKLVAGWKEGFAANNDAATLHAIGDRLRHFNDLFTDVRRGDEIALDYLPGEGTRVVLNGHLRGRVPGADFFRALLRVWLGPNPVKAGLKAALLGKT